MKKLIALACSACSISVIALLGSSLPAAADDSTALLLRASAVPCLRPTQRGHRQSRLLPRTRASSLFTPQFSTTLSDQSLFPSNPCTGSTGASIDFVLDGLATLTAAYGLTNRLRISLVESALIGTNNTHFNATSNTTTMTSSNGLSDPTFGANFRYLDDDARTGLSGRRRSHGAPFVGHARYRRLQPSGTAATRRKGYGTAALSAPAFWWLGHNELEFNPSVTRDFSGNGVGPTVQTSNIRAAAWNGSLALLDRFHVTDSFYLQAGGALSLPYSVQTTSLNAAGTVSTNQYPAYFVPRFDVGYRATASVLFDAEYQYFNYTTQILETSSATQIIESTLAMKCMIQI